MTKIVLHIGAAKTATTYIQHALFRNEEMLSEHGVYLPKAGRFDFRNKTVAHHHLGWEYLDPKQFKAGGTGWDDLIYELQNVVADTVIITSESLERMSYTEKRRKQFEHQLKRLPGDAEIVYVVRDQLSRINSLYTQRVKALRPTQPFPEYAASMIKTGNFDLHGCFQDWYDRKDLKLVALPFADVISGDPFEAFLTAAQVDVPFADLEVPDSAINVSPGPIAVEAARLLGQYLRAIDPSFGRSKNIVRRLYRVASAEARDKGWCEEKFWGWTPKAARKVSQRLQESNELFALSVWGRGHPLEMPVDKPASTADLLKLDESTFSAVQEYVAGLTRRYLEMRAQRSLRQSGASIQTDSEEAADADEPSPQRSGDVEAVEGAHAAE